MKENLFKIVIMPKSEDEYKSIQKLLTRQGVLFSSAVNGEESDKSPEESRLETEFSQLSGKQRFRLTKEQTESVKKGKSTRLDHLREFVKELRKTAKKATTKAAKSVKKTVKAVKRGAKKAIRGAATAAATA